MAKNLGALSWTLKANSKPFNKELKSATRGAKSAGARISRALTAGGKAGIAALSVTAVAAGAVYMRTARSADVLAKSADAIGISTVKLAGYQHQAELTGVSSEKLSAALKKQNKNIGEAQQGTGEAKTQLELLGLANAEFFALSPDKQFENIADKISKLGSRTEQAAAASALYGRTGVDMLNMLDGGSAGLAAAALEAERFGVALTRVDAAKFEAANDAMHRGGQAVKGLSNTFSVALAPMVTAVATAFADTAAESDGFKSSVKSAMSRAVEGVGYAANAVRSLQIAWAGVKVGVAESMATTVELLASGDRALTDFLNKIPGVNEVTYGALQEMAISLRNVAGDSVKDLDKLVAKGMPHGAVIKWAKEAQIKADEAARKVAADRTAQFTPAGGDNVTVLADKAAQELAINQNKNNQLIEQNLQMQGRFEEAENLRFEALTEREALALERAREKGAVSEEVEQSYRERSELLEQQHQIRLAQIHKKRLKDLTIGQKFEMASSKQKTKTVLGDLQTMTQGVAQHSKKMFNINKAAGIANATVSTIEGAQRAYAQYAAYPPVAAAMAGLAIAAGMARVAAISSTSFGGGGGGVAPANVASGGAPIGGFTSSPVSGEPIAPASAGVGDAADQKQPISFIFNAPVTQDGAEWVAEMFQEAIERDYIIVDSVA